VSETAIGREDLIQLRESVERWVEKDYPFTRRKAALASAAGYDPGTWRSYAELGWLGLSIPEAHGGAGLDDAALLCLMTAAGRGLLMEPILSTCVLGAGLIAACGTPAQQAAHLPGIVSGDSKIALAHTEPQLGFARGPITTRARRDHAGWTLSGEKCAVLDGPGADTLLVTAIDPDDQLGLFLLPRDAAAVE
jgi:alkylation response protein AidB-like acyl-CoA dehydrogenase